jgi:hypothetical protein
LDKVQFLSYPLQHQPSGGDQDKQKEQTEYRFSLFHHRFSSSTKTFFNPDSLPRYAINVISFFFLERDILISGN